MQVILGSRGDYSVRAVLYLARQPGVRRRREISAAMDIPDKFLPQILGALVLLAGLVWLYVYAPCGVFYWNNGNDVPERCRLALGRE